jgi:hypothetical protein
MAGRRTARGNAGRILPHERDTDNSVPVLGAEFNDLGENYSNLYNETLQHDMNDRTRKDYRRRLIRIAKYWEEHCPEYYPVGTRDVTAVDLHAVGKYFYGKYKKDLVYQGLNVKYVIKFLMCTKRKANGHFLSFVDIRKYKDAILWASSMAEERLPTNFYEEMEKYLKGYKKELVKAKKDGNLDESSADPISFALYYLLLKWSIESNNVFLWFWTIAQWNFMARSASIDPLGFHNFSLGGDSLIAKYDDSKADKDGEKLSEKNTYANPDNYLLCFWTGMGIWCALNVDNLCGSEKLFLSSTAKDGTAACRYQEQLMGLVEANMDSVVHHIRISHMNAYGIRKGSATLATSGTTCPPPIPSIARRGEWSMGTVLDVYWHFSEPGDHYLGRILAGLDPKKSTFSSLPPHWKLVNPMENERVALAMEMMYGRIMHHHQNTPDNPLAMLLRCLACIVHHSRSILAAMVANPGHDFAKLPILHDQDLLRDLRLLVTTQPTPGVMATPTGIPPHVELASQLQEILTNVGSLVSNFSEQTTRISEVVKTAIDEKAWESGQVTGTRLREILATFQVESMDAVNSRLDSIRTEFQRVAAGRGDGGGAEDDNNNFDMEEDEEGVQRQPSCFFAYGGHFFDVPKDFCFSKATLREGLRFWLKGQTVSTDGTKAIKPFRLLKLVGLPSAQLKNIFKNQWKPIFSFLEENGAYQVPRQSHLMTDVAIESIYDQCVNFLKENVSFCFQSRRTNATQWGVGTWSLKTRRSTILKHGTEADKAKVAAATNRNQAKRTTTRPGRQGAVNPHYRYRQRQRVERLFRNNLPAERNDLQQQENQQGQQQATTQEDGDDAFGNAFPEARIDDLPEAARARHQQIQQEVAGEVRVERAEQQATQIVVGEDGGPLFVRVAADGEAPVTGTEAHRAWLSRQVDNLPT